MHRGIIHDHMPGYWLSLLSAAVQERIHAESELPEAPVLSSNASQFRCSGLFWRAGECAQPPGQVVGDLPIRSE